MTTRPTPHTRPAAPAPAPAAGATLDRRTLNRSLLARQSLLRRNAVGAAEAIERLVGMQAQVPQDPYVGLWSRVADFAPDELSDLLSGRAAVRIGLMRWTIHLVTARDCLALRPVMQRVIDQRMLGAFRKALAGLDLDEVVRAARPLLEERPMTTSELGDRLRERWPDRDRLALGAAVGARLPLVQPPPRGLWRTSGAARHVPADTWLDAAALRPESHPDPDPDTKTGTDTDTRTDTAVLRYLAAFGPASAADIAVWSGLTAVRTVLARLADRLVNYRDERGTELYDVPGAPFPGPDVPAPPRFLPQYDNLLLSHDDRSRVFRTDDDRARVVYSGRERRGTYLVDGFVHGIWRLDERRDGATLVVEPFGEWTSAEDRAAVEAEAVHLLAFLTDTGRSRTHHGRSHMTRDQAGALTVDMRTGASTAQGTVETPEPEEDRQ